MTEAVARSCCAKAAIVAGDERETGDRALLNLGHTFGHAFEALTGYDNMLLHGEAVAYGMVLAFNFSVARGHCAPEDAARLKDHIGASHLPQKMSAIGTGKFAADALDRGHEPRQESSKRSNALYFGQWLGRHIYRRQCQRNRIA